MFTVKDLVEVSREKSYCCAIRRRSSSSVPSLSSCLHAEIDPCCKYKKGVCNIFCQDRIYAFSVSQIEDSSAALQLRLLSLIKLSSLLKNTVSCRVIRIGKVLSNHTVLR